jgi:hypothetical protein
MVDYSKRALGGRGQEPQEMMRVFLGCKEPPPGVNAYDFRKGEVKFEYKHSTLQARNQSSKQRRSGPTKTWVFQGFRGADRKKDYDYLILEGDCETKGESEVFLIPFAELVASYPNKDRAPVTKPMAKSSRRMRGVSEFVWAHQVAKEKLKSLCDGLLEDGITKPLRLSEPQNQGQLTLWKAQSKSQDD